MVIAVSRDDRARDQPHETIERSFLRRNNLGSNLKNEEPHFVHLQIHVRPGGPGF
jgi:hypothetical protein